MWRLRSLLPGVSGQDRVTEVSSPTPRAARALTTCLQLTRSFMSPFLPLPSQLELVEATIAYIGYLQGMLQEQGGGGGKDIDVPTLGEMVELLRGLNVSS